jgi:hypothetical protein
MGEVDVDRVHFTAGKIPPTSTFPANIHSTRDRVNELYRDLSTTTTGFAL